VPVVASRVGGLVDLAPEVTLVAPDDPTALGAAVEHVLAAPPPAEQLRARVRRLAWADVAARLHAHAVG
jgi:glycosyltransferase involved in cell wall biosynthesis